MSINSLTAEEALDEIANLLKNPNKIKKKDIIGIVERRSIIDNRAGANAETLLFAGRFDNGTHSGIIVDRILKKNLENYRAVTRTPFQTVDYQKNFIEAVQHATRNEYGNIEVDPNIISADAHVIIPTNN